MRDPSWSLSAVADRLWDCGRCVDQLEIREERNAEPLDNFSHPDKRATIVAKRCLHSCMANQSGHLEHVDAVLEERRDEPAA